MHKFSDRIKKEVEEIITKVGGFQFESEGPESCMENLDELKAEYLSLSQVERIQVASDLKNDDHCDDVVGCIILSAFTEDELTEKELRELARNVSSETQSQLEDLL